MHTFKQPQCTCHFELGLGLHGFIGPAVTGLLGKVFGSVVL